MTLPDTQASESLLDVELDEAGFSRIKYPFRYQIRDSIYPTIGLFDLGVSVDRHKKGAHMSRMVSSLDRWCEKTNSVDTFADLAEEIRTNSGSIHAEVRVLFDVHLLRTAPVSRTQGRMPYTCGAAAISTPDRSRILLKATALTKSLCPCSKEISDYGAHNQRSIITMEIDASMGIDHQDLIDLAENSCSCRLYPILKRVDEKHVTEHAYENPKFVEDAARAVATVLQADCRVLGFNVSVRNEESILPYDALASVSGGTLRRR